MKKLLILLFLISIFSCNKTVQVSVNKEESMERVGGLVDIDAEDSTTRLVVSNNLLQETKVSFRGKPVKDNIAPTIQITSPTNGATVSGMVPILVSASDNVGVVSVEFRVNGSTAGYGSFTLNADNYKGTIVQISAIARDKASNTAIHTISVIVNGEVIDTTTNNNTTIKIYTPPVLNQGSEGSCVGFAVGYYAKSIEWYYKTNSTMTFSPEHLYNEVKFSEDCGSGTAMQTALDFVKLNGILPFNEMPYSSSNGCSLKATETQKVIASNYKIQSYVKMYTTDSIAIKSMINNNHPVIISVSVDYTFTSATGDFIWKNTLNQFSFGHCICIVGYDDVKHAWLVINSWGTSWGKNGLAWIDYDFFLTRTGTYCYSIID